MTGQRPRRRLALWASLGVGVLLAVLVAVFASAGSVTNNSQHSPLVGQPAPALAGRVIGAGGRRVSLSGYAGKWVLVNFSASWCSACRAEMPQLLAFSHTAARYGAVVLGVEYDPGDAASLRRWDLSVHASWPTITAPSDSLDWALTGIPDSYLVNPNGIVVYYSASGIDPTALDAAITSADAAASPSGS